MEQESHIVKIISTKNVTHNVKSFRLQKPTGYHFVPGQATEVSVNSNEWKEEKRPFTFTCLPEDNHLEFTIKIYTDHKGVTNALGKLKEGDELIIRDVWGAIEYKGPGVFIAGGAGITPFIAIFRKLYKDAKTGGNKLFFSNKTAGDIILKEELEKILGDNFTNVLTAEQKSSYEYGRINEAFLKQHLENFKQHFYICGPDPFVQDISATLEKLGADIESIVFEK